MNVSRGSVDEAARSGAGRAAERGRDAAALPRWARDAPVPDYLRLRQGDGALVIVAPHGGKRRRPIRRGDSVNDLHTAEIAWELAERTGAHAIVNHGLDRNDIDLNRITHLVERAPEVLGLLCAAIGDASADGRVPLVIFVHGWNMVVPCCDIGIGVRRRAGRLSGRFPTLGRDRFEGAVAAIEAELSRRGVSAAIGRRYTASGRDNAAQLFSGRHADHADATVSALARLALAERVDAAQLELGIPLRWPGPMRDALVEGLVAALAPESTREIPRGRAGGDVPPLSRRADAGPSLHVREGLGPLIPGTDERDSPSASPAPRVAWRPFLETTESVVADFSPEPGFALQAVLDPGGRTATFCGVEATGPRSMAARFSIVSTDGSMMLLVGEGEWSGRSGHYQLEGFEWRWHDAGTVTLRVRGPMVRYPSHDAYLDLESGLASASIVDGDVELEFATVAPGHGRLTGSVRTGTIEHRVDTVAFLDRGGRAQTAATDRVRVAVARDNGEVVLVRSDQEEGITVEATATGLGAIRFAGAAAGGLADAAIRARVPVWRPLGNGSFLRWTFGIAACRFHGDTGEAPGLFDTVEVFRRPGAA